MKREQGGERREASSPGSSHFKRQTYRGERNMPIGCFPLLFLFFFSCRGIQSVPETGIVSGYVGCSVSVGRLLLSVIFIPFTSSSSLLTLFVLCHVSRSALSSSKVNLSLHPTICRMTMKSTAMSSSVHTFARTAHSFTCSALFAALARSASLIRH